MDKLYKVEKALCKAVNEKRDFSHCASYIGGILHSLSQEQTDTILLELEKFLNEYSPGYK